MLLQKSKLYESRLFDFSISQLVYNDKIINSDLKSIGGCFSPVFSRENIDWMRSRISLINFWEALSWEITEQYEYSMCMYIYDKCTDEKSSDLGSALGYAILNKRYSLGKYILKRYKIPEYMKSTPISMCAETEDLSVVKFLVKNLKDTEPLDLAFVLTTACEYLRKDITEYIFSQIDGYIPDTISNIFSNLMVDICCKGEDTRRDFLQFFGQLCISQGYDHRTYKFPEIIKRYLLRLS